MKALRLEFKGGNPFKPGNDLLYFQRTGSTKGAVVNTKVKPDTSPYISAYFYGEGQGPNIQYSTDNGNTFQNWESTYDEQEQTRVYDDIILGSIGDKVLFKGTNENLSNQDATFCFYIPEPGIEAGGSVTSLLDGDGVTLLSIPDYAFQFLFADTSITKAPSLGNVTSIGNFGLEEMFSGCHLLEAAPSFEKVIQIQSNGCYRMFNGCENLNEAANMDNVQIIGESGCINMYRGTNVRKAADMKSLTTVMEVGLAGMYFVCETLTSAADMGGVEEFGESAFKGMYGDTENLVLLEGESLTFEFPNLPVDAGSTTFTTNEQVAEEMKYNK